MQSAVEQIWWLCVVQSAEYRADIVLSEKEALLRPILYIVQYTSYSFHLAVYSVQLSVYSVQLAVYSVQLAV